MKNLKSSDKIYIATSNIPDAGRGVFANKPIKKGEIIERCPVLILPEHEEEIIGKSILATYVYFLGKRKKRLTLALGWGSIYNHAHSPNARYNEIAIDQVIEFIAMRDIEENEEITVNYVQGNQKDNKPLWFEVSSIPLNKKVLL